MPITRRDFLNGVALAITGLGTGALTSCKQNANNAGGSASDATGSAAGSAPAASGSLNAGTAPNPAYPPALTGLRGNHLGSFEVAHELGWQKKTFDVAAQPSEGHFDLVVVGAGISGLAAAYYYQKRHPDHKILLLDNHDDFGGHAKRNEFHATDSQGRPVFRLSYGGSESIDSPKTHYSKEAAALLQELGIAYEKFEQFYDQKFFDRHNMQKGTFYNQATFGQSKVIASEPDSKNADQFFAQAPLPEADKAALIELYSHPKDYLAPMPKAKRDDYLASISYDKFLTEHVRLPEKAKAFLEDICLEYWGFPIDCLSAQDAMNEGYPGLDNLGITPDKEPKEPYIYHFPDGNASIARLLVKKLIPDVVANPEHAAQMTAMEAIVLDKFDYSRLDRPNQTAAIRLNSTVVQTKNQDNGVMVGYKTGGTLHRVDATHCILAGYNMMIPYIASDLPGQQKQDLQQNVKVPLIYAKVLVKNWHAFKKLGVHTLYAPKAPYCLVMLDYPVSMGGYEYPKTPDEPMIIHMVRVPVPFGTGKTLREACKIGRNEVYQKSYAELESQMLGQLREIFAQAGETLDDKILAITLNRWGHGYSYENNILWDQPAAAERLLANVKKPLGRIHIANSDADWQPYANGAIDQGRRAVQEILGTAKA